MDSGGFRPVRPRAQEQRTWKPKNGTGVVCVSWLTHAESHSVLDIIDSDAQRAISCIVGQPERQRLLSSGMPRSCRPSFCIPAGRDGDWRLQGTGRVGSQSQETRPTAPRTPWEWVRESEASHTTDLAMLPLTEGKPKGVFFENLVVYSLRPSLFSVRSWCIADSTPQRGESIPIRSTASYRVPCPTPSAESRASHHNFVPP